MIDKGLQTFRRAQVWRAGESGKQERQSAAEFAVSKYAPHAPSTWHIEGRKSNVHVGRNFPKCAASGASAAPDLSFFCWQKRPMIQIVKFCFGVFFPAVF